MRMTPATSAVTIAGSYIVGGLIPLLPYMLGTTRNRASRLRWNHPAGPAALRGRQGPRVTGAGVVRSGLQTVIIGGVAAAAAFGLAHLLSAH